MAISFEKGAIVKKSAFHKETLYDISNNLLTAQFDGRGGIMKYAVVNKWNFVSKFYNVMSVNDEIVDFTVPKKVTMVGRSQTIELEERGVRIIIEQFADDKTNAVFQEFHIKSEKDITFSRVFNIEVDFNSYISTLFAARFSLRNLGRLLFGSLKNFLKGMSKTESYKEFTVVKNNPWGEFYLDVAMNGESSPLEKVVYHNQYEMKKSIKAGESFCLRSVISMGTRKDFSEADVKVLIENFDDYKKKANEHIESLNPPESCNTEYLKSYYNNLYNCALTMYKEKDDFKGFLAGLIYQSPARTYYRDGYWTILAVLPRKPELVRNEIITLSRGINKDGACPSAVKYNFTNYWGKHYDSPSFFVIMLFDYVRATGDKTILCEKWGRGTILSAAIKVIEKLSENEDSTGLLNKKGPFNRRDWCDNVFRHGYVTYDEALYARALFALSYLTEGTKFEYLKNSFFEKYTKVKDAINTLLWDSEKGYYVNYKDENFVEDNLSIDTVVTVLFGIADDKRAKSVLNNMEKILESANNKEQKAGDFGVLSVYPFYKRAASTVGKSSFPYYYHNGGDWPYWSNIYAYAKLKHKMDYMYPLTRWFDYNLEKDNFTPVEFFSPFHKEGSLLQSWSSTGAFLFSYPDGKFFEVEEKSKEKE